MQSYVNQSTLDCSVSDPVFNKFGLMEPGTPMNVQCQFLTHNDLQGQSAKSVHLNSKQPLSETTTRIQPSAPPASMLHLNTQNQQWESSTGKKGFQPNGNKFVESSEKPKQSTFQTHNQVPRPHTAQMNGTKPYNPLYPNLSSSSSVNPGLYSQNTLKPKANTKSPNLYSYKIAKPEKNPDCAIS